MERVADSDDRVTDNDSDCEQRPTSYEELVTRLGPRGFYPCMILISMACVNGYVGALTLAATFTTAIPEHHCNMNKSLPNNATDCYVEASDDQCMLMVNCSHSSWQQKCSSWIFDESVFTSTIVSRFELVCDSSHLADLTTTLFFAGFLIGSTSYGMVSDYFGRRVALLIGLTNLILSNIGAAAAPNWWMYTVAMVFVGIGGGGSTTVTYAFTSESTNQRNRLAWSMNVGNGWSAGVMILTLIAYLERNYQLLLLWLSAGAVVYVPLVLLAGESPRWLLSTGRLHRAHETILRVARINRATDKLPTGFNAAELVPSNNNKCSTSYGIVDLFRTSGIRRITLLGWIHWFVASMTYYGISLSAGTIGGNIFVNAVLVAAVEMPARWSGMLLTFIGLGRKTVLYASFTLSAVFLAGMVGIYDQNNLEPLRIALAISSKTCITLAFAIVWLYYNELFPTVIRSVGVGSGSTVARIGAIASTQMLPLSKVWQPLPFIIFGTGPFIACLVIYFLPETLGRTLPETIADGEAFVNGRAGLTALVGERIIEVDGTDD